MTRKTSLAGVSCRQNKSLRLCLFAISIALKTRFKLTFRPRFLALRRRDFLENPKLLPLMNHFRLLPVEDHPRVDARDWR